MDGPQLSWGEVVFTDKARSVTTEVEGEPVLFPAATRVVSRSAGKVEVEPVGGIGDDGTPDVLVGRLPVVTRCDRRLIAEYIDLLAPPPFEDSDVSQMWETLKDSPVPMPSGIYAQGRLDLADPSALRSEGIEPEFLPVAHSAARTLAVDWPHTESIQQVWRPIDVIGGREDERGTERRAGFFPAVVQQDGTIRPASTSRVVPAGHAWRSSLLATHAREVIQRLDRLSCPMNRRILAPFEMVAKQAHDPMGAPEQPLSTWPAKASAALTSLRALLSGVIETEEGRASAPLCSLWRLYEAWVAVQILSALVADDRLSQRSKPQRGHGDDWHVVFDGPKGRIILVAQPDISNDEGNAESLEPTAVFSVSSRLQPDAIVAVEDRVSGAWLVDVYDAKKRTHAMSSSDVAEAASKYVWGIRRVDPAPMNLVVRNATIVTTLDAGAMYSVDSRIESLCAMPSGSGCAALAEKLRQRIDA